MATAKNNNSKKATILGLLTTLLMQITVIDYSQFDFNNKADLIKFMLTLIPALGGAMSSVIKTNTLFKKRSYIAPVFGFLTTVCTTWACIDFNTFDLSNRNNIVKLFVLILPAISGFISEINGEKQE